MKKTLFDEVEAELTAEETEEIKENIKEILRKKKEILYCIQNKKKELKEINKKINNVKKGNYSDITENDTQDEE